MKRIRLLQFEPFCFHHCRIMPQVLLLLSLLIALVLSLSYGSRTNDIDVIGVFGGPITPAAGDVG